MSSSPLTSPSVLRAAWMELNRLRECGDGEGFSALCRQLEGDSRDWMGLLCLPSLSPSERKEWADSGGLDYRPSFRWGGVSVRIREESAIAPILNSWRSGDLQISALRLEGVDPGCILPLVEADRLPSLMELAIEGCGLASRGSSYPVSDRVLQVDLSGHEEVLKALSSFGRLRVLRLADNRLGNRGLKVLRGFYRLEGLELRGNAISDSGLEALSALEMLQRLGLSKNRIKGPGLSCFSHMKQLRHLDLHGNPLEDLGALMQLGGLEKLNVADCGLSEPARAALDARLQNCEVR